MNQKAKKQGMKHTIFKNVTGLHDKDHYTTAEDLSLLLEYALKIRSFMKFSLQKVIAWLPQLPIRKDLQVYSTPCMGNGAERNFGAGNSGRKDRLYLGSRTLSGKSFKLRGEGVYSDNRRRTGES